MTPFRDLAEVFQRLERTSSNAALVSILAAFLSKLTPDEARAVAYLVRGEVAAPFAAREIGMAERMVMRAVAEAYAVPERRVERLLAITGDLGTVAEQLARSKRRRPKTILSIFEELRSIARISGEGSQQQIIETAFRRLGR
jgi:DNA ligase-1